MSAIVLPDRWSRQPAFLADLDASQPINSRVIVAVSHAVQGDRIFDSSRHKRHSNAIVKTNAGYVPTPQGWALDLSGSQANGDVSFGSVAWWGGLTRASWEIAFQLDALATEVKLASQWGGGWVWLVSVLSTGEVQLVIEESGAKIWKTAAGVITTGKHFHVVISWGGSPSATACYVNGVPVAWAATPAASSVIGSSATAFQLGTAVDGGPVNGRIGKFTSWGRALTAGEAKLLYEQPWAMYTPIQRRIYLASPAGGAAALAGVATGQSSASGGLTTDIRLAGAAAGQSSASGALTTDIRIAGAAVALATADASLTTTVSLAGAAASVSVASGVLTTQIRLEGSALAQAVASGAMSGGALLQGAAYGQSDASGALSTQIALAGVAAATAAGAGDLTVQIRLSGAAVASATGSADLTTASSGLAGSALSTGAGSGSLTTQIPLAGAAQAYAVAAGEITTIVQLAGAAASVTSGVGSLDVAIRLNGAAAAQALASAALTTIIRLDAVAVAQAAASGALSDAVAEAAIPTTRTLHLIGGDRALLLKAGR